MGIKVLIVDDEEPIANLCAELLKIQGFETEMAFDPFDALAVLDRQFFDLLLVDYRMPQLNGFQMMDKARRLQPHLAVVMMTGVGTMETATEALRRGADGLTLKPFTAAELVENIRYALEMRARRQDGQRLQAIRPLFDVTEQLFSKTDLVHLEEFLVKAAHDLIPSAAVGLFDLSMVAAEPAAMGQAHVLDRHGRSHSSAAKFGDAQFGGVTLCSAPTGAQALLLAARLVMLHYNQGNPANEGFPEIWQANDDSSVLVPDHQELKSLGFGPYIGKYLTHVPDPHWSMLIDPVPAGALAPSDTARQIEPKTRILVLLREAGETQFQRSEMETFLILCRQGAAAIENATLNAELQATISRLKEREHTLRDTVQRLETSQLALLHAEKLATAGRLTASIAHEIKNPLQALQNCLHIGRRTDLESAARDEYLELAENELDRLKTTVQRMLEYYRPGQVVRQPVNIHTLLEHVLELTHNQLEKQQIELVRNYAENLPEVEVVADQIHQVFLNLVLNACQAMEGQPGRLMISTCARLAAGPAAAGSDDDGAEEKCMTQVEVLFEDTGPGIPEEIMPHLFEPFQSSKPEGLGLGLPISYGIISAHGGEIQGLSTPQGAKFRISLFSQVCV